MEDNQNPDGSEAIPPMVTDETIDSMLALLSLPETLDRSAFKRRLTLIAQTWAMYLWAIGSPAKPGDQRAAIRRMAVAIDKVLDALHEVSPEYQVALAPMLGREFQTRDLVPEARSVLVSLREAALLFDAAFHPPRGAPPNIGLEEAVRGVIDLLLSVGCALPEVSSGREHMPPRLINAEAKAIGLLIQSVSNLQVGTIVNMITKVRSNAKATEPIEFAIWRTDPDGELDLCLHPARKRILEN
ncbi:hypothetical protein [Sphingomonas sp.]|uniref:hypothetical protein n=1 Tax=Sphingomonas sp. TaxID=28214 RepID=UPI0018292D7C|nr:hypothetical protein [Sphingomonas sp.]MBA3512330.1 hypothetical protein [Sphingomonas sp.]